MFLVTLAVLVVLVPIILTLTVLWFLHLDKTTKYPITLGTAYSALVVVIIFGAYVIGQHAYNQSTPVREDTTVVSLEINEAVGGYLADGVDGNIVALTVSDDRVTPFSLDPGNLDFTYGSEAATLEITTSYNRYGGVITTDYEVNLP